MQKISVMFGYEGLSFTQQKGRGKKIPRPLYFLFNLTVFSKLFEFGNRHFALRNRKKFVVVLIYHIAGQVY